MAVFLAFSIAACLLYGERLQGHWPEEQRIMIRTVLYIGAIVGLPLTNLIRFIQLRLNETIPGDKPAKQRYLLTVIVSMILIESVGLAGLVMFLLGDGYNTLYIFTGLSALGLFLYRPKPEEYSRICQALEAKNKFY
jgi:hypothetical protein